MPYKAFQGAYEAQLRAALGCSKVLMPPFLPYKAFQGPYKSGSDDQLSSFEDCEIQPPIAIGALEEAMRIETYL